MKIIEKTKKKFYKNKDYKYFPGTSIVNMLTDKELLKTINDIVKEMKNELLFDKFVFLPESSYHMTICDLVTYDDLFENDKYNSLNFNIEDDFNINDKKQAELLKDIDFNLNVKMVVDKISHKQIILKPKTILDEHKISMFRKKVYELIGIKIKNNYKFHISLAYQLYELDKVENEILELFLKQLNDKYLGKFKDIKIKAPMLVAFNDMSEFRDINKGRMNLGLTTQ